MRKEKSLSEMFEQAREEARKIPVGEVKSLLESGQTSPLASKPSYRPRRIIRLFNPLKFFIMITPIILITAGLLNWNTDRNVPVEQPEQIKAEQTNQSTSTTKTEAALIKPRPADRPTVPEPAAIPDFNPGVPVEAAQPVQKDTILAGVILDLSKEELTRLGFMFDDEGYYYLNQLPDGSKMNCWSYKGQYGGSFGFGSGGYVNPSNKAALRNLDFYPVLTTNLSGEDFYPIDQVAAQVNKSFELMNDTLVPVLFTKGKLGGYQTEDKLVWFKVSDSFFERLKTERSEQSQLLYNRVKELNNNTAHSNRVVYDFLPAIQLTNAIRLKPEVLRCMGVNYSAKAIDVTIRAIEYWFNIHLWIENDQTVFQAIPTEVSPIKTPEDTLLPTTESIVLLGISNFGSIKMVDMPTRVYRQLNKKDLTFEQYLDLCIPVIVDSKAISSNGKETILWIYPNERFFSCLPPEIAEPMRKEFNYQLKKMNPDSSPVMGGSIGIGNNTQQKDTVNEAIEPVPCVYFTNLCETIPGLDYINLYPNPASDKINVDLVLQAARKIRFRVFDLGGRVISDDGAVENYPTGGRFTHQLDVSSLQKGFYLLVLTDEEGARMTRRFIRE
ncbi:MAG: T9SS type A sorting domain-containing protein [Bacteroidales bacterium]|nr:T9SS type A sorting domain-containing protein [Bacteroidales bacterium]